MANVRVADGRVFFIPDDELLIANGEKAAISPGRAARRHPGLVIGKLKVGDRFLWGEPDAVSKVLMLEVAAIE